MTPTFRVSKLLFSIMLFLASLAGAQSTLGESSSKTAQRALEQTPAASTAKAATDDDVLFLPKGVRFSAVLLDTVDSLQAKKGAPIEAAMYGKVVINGNQLAPGSKLVGHITEVKARGNGDSVSLLGLMFDKIQAPAGTAIPIVGTIQAIGPPSELVPGKKVGEMRMHAPPGANGVNYVWYPGDRPLQVKLADQGVMGGMHVTLASDPQKGSDLSSSAKSLRLEAGTQMVVVTR